MIKEEILINDLEKVRKKIGEIPSSKIYRKEGSYHPITFERRFGSWNKTLLHVFGEIKRATPQKRTEKKCINCDIVTLNPKFCSTKCSATYNNKLRGGPPVFCKCGKRISCNTKFCSPCQKLNSIEEYGEKIIGEFRKLPAIAKNRYVLVRGHADRVMKHNNLKVNYCLLCDYKNHVQLCHIKDIGDFPDSAKLKEINNPDNLVYLCPNHHWDLDHDFLSEKEMRVIFSRNKALNEN